jgi:hypothetical protein
MYGDAEGAMHRRMEGGSRWEEGEPRERNSVACRKEAPEGALRMLQSLSGVPSAVQLFLPFIGIRFQVNASNQLLSFRLENRMDRTAFRILFFS